MLSGLVAWGFVAYQVKGRKVEECQGRKVKERRNAKEVQGRSRKTKALSQNNMYMHRYIDLCVYTYI
jgi:hypothetical protein